jgi:hypothetical protein
MSLSIDWQFSEERFPEPQKMRILTAQTESLAQGFITILIKSQALLLWHKRTWLSLHERMNPYEAKPTS